MAPLRSIRLFGLFGGTTEVDLAVDGRGRGGRILFFFEGATDAALGMPAIKLFVNWLDPVNQVKGALSS
jgi:hypothetical protein